MKYTEIAGTLILEDRGLLLLYREDHSWWELPGGKVKENENPTQTAVREASEEIGVEVDLEKPFFSGEFEHDGELYLWHGYIGDTEDNPELGDADCSCGESACNSNPEECCEQKFSEMKYFNAEDLDEKELAPNLRQIRPALRRLLS